MATREPVRRAAASPAIRSATFRLTVLGSGTAVPVPGDARAPSCHLVSHAGRHALLDCGPAAVVRLAEADVTLDDLDAIAVTHIHSDHCSGLVPILQGMWSNPKYRRTRRLDVIGPAGLAEVLDGITSAWPSLAEPLDPIGGIVDVSAWSDGEHRCGPFEIEALPVRHAGGSVALRVRLAGCAGPLLVYSGDCDDASDLARVAKGADLLLTECARAETDTATPVHLRPSDVAEAVAAAGVGWVVLTHLYPDVDPEEARAIVAATGACVELATDLAAYDIRSSF